MGSRRIAAILSVLTLAAVPASAQIDLTGSYTSRMHEDWFIRGPGRPTEYSHPRTLNPGATEGGGTSDPRLYGSDARTCARFSAELSTAICVSDSVIP